MKGIAVLLATFLVGVCTGTFTKRDVGSAVTCQDCKTFGKDIVDILHSKTEDQIKQIVLNICQQFTAQPEICNQIVLSYFDLVYDYIMNHFVPDQICNLMGFCDQTNNKPELKMIQSKLIGEKQLGDSIECEFCQVVIQHLKDMIVTTNPTKDSKVICKAIHLCNGNSNLPQFLPMAKLTPAISEDKMVKVKLPEVLMRPLSKQKTETCQFCEVVMGIMTMMLRENKTKEAIEHALDHVCNEVPTAFQQRCRDFIDKYAEQLIDSLEKEDPTEICSFLGLCEEMKLIAAKNLKIDKCLACQIIVDYIDNFLGDNATEQEITNVIERVCNIVPKSFQQKCESLIESFGTDILQILAEWLDGKTVCTAINLCSQTLGEVHLIGGKKCTFGQGYWCKSVQHARSCNAEEHCKKFVWKNWLGDKI